MSEYWAIIRNPKSNISIIADITGYDAERIKKWWYLKDNKDPSVFLIFIESLE